MKKKIFVVDDEADIQDILRLNLEGEGYSVFTFSSAEEAEKELHRKPDLIVLDIMMEGMGGYDFCRKLRSQDEYSTIPVIFLSAKSEEFDKVLGLELGGDDYITKPFGVKEFISRVKAVLRRAGLKEKTKVSDGQKLIFKGIEVFPDQFKVRIDGDDVKLTKTEFEILLLFMKNIGKIFTRDNIIDSIRGEDVYVVDRTIDVHVMNLRKKIGKYKDHVTTFSGVGYGIKE